MGTGMSRFRQRFGHEGHSDLCQAPAGDKTGTKPCMTRVVTTTIITTHTDPETKVVTTTTKITTDYPIKDAIDPLTMKTSEVITWIRSPAVTVMVENMARPNGLIASACLCKIHADGVLRSKGPDYAKFTPLVAS